MNPVGRTRASVGPSGRTERSKEFHDGPLFRVARVVQALLFILTIGGVASIYPAIRAATIDVSEAMKFER